MQHEWNIELDSTETIFSFEGHLNQGKSDETGRIRPYWIRKSLSPNQQLNRSTLTQVEKLTWNINLTVLNVYKYNLTKML